MDKIIIKGGATLKGEVTVSGSKNAILPLMFSTLLAKGKHVFHNVPDLKDVHTTCQLLQYLGCQIKKTASTVIINHKILRSYKAPYNLVRQMRAGILSLGPLIAHYKKAEVSLPGGCAIGTRPVHWHVKGLQTMGADIDTKKGFLSGKLVKNSSRLKGGRILMEYPSVGVTENLMMAACLAQNPSVIENAAREPEIVDLAFYLQTMGADIKGAGTDKITIQPVDCLKPGEHKVMPDRIEAGTLLLAGAITGGELFIKNTKARDLTALILKLQASGFHITIAKDGVGLSSTKNIPQAVDITTRPYPGFPTDLQAQFMALLTQSDGVSLVTENIFENRFMHIQELVRLGADIQLNGHTARVLGPQRLQSAPITATDLRASACLILAGLVAKGESVLQRVYHLDRGYAFLEKKLSSLGAYIKRI